MTENTEIPEKLYKKLSKADKLNILTYERGANALIRLDSGQYESIEEFPVPSPRPSDLYISNVLGIDYREFYKSDLAKKSWDMKDIMKDIATPLEPSGYRSVFIGDILSDIMYIYTHPDADHDLEKIIPKLDKKLKSTYNKFMTLVDMAGDGHKYEKASVVDGEQLYRRVK